MSNSKQNTLHAFFTSTSRTRSDNPSTSASIPSPVTSNIHDEILDVGYDSDFDDETLSSPIQCSVTDIPDTNNTIELVEEKHSTFVHIDDVEQAVDTDTIEADEFYDVAEADIMNEEMEMDLTAPCESARSKAFDKSKGVLWMPKEQDEVAFAISGNTCPDNLYEPDVFIWLPHLLFGRGFKKIACPECRSDKITIKGYNDEPFARRIICEEKSFYLMTIRYKCNNFSPSTYTKETFQGTDEKVIRQLYPNAQRLFPAVLSPRSGFSKRLLESIRRDIQFSNGPDRILKKLAEKHHKRFNELQLTYLINVTEHRNRRTLFEPVITVFEEFSTFNDPMKLSGTILKGDHSHKFNKKTYKINGVPSFTGLYTVTNEYDEIRMMILTPTKALDFLKGPFKSMLTSLRANNYDEPVVYYTDNVDADRNFLESVFPSLTNDVARLESTPDQTVAPSLPMLSSVPSSVTVHCYHDAQAISGVCYDIMKDIDRRHNKKVCVGFDVEWCIMANGPRTMAKVSICQIAYKDCVYIFQLSRCIKVSRNKAFPQGLKKLIGCGEVMKIGRSVKNDLQRLFSDYNVVYNGFLELHQLCYDVGRLLTPGKDSSLAALTRIILEKTLPKGNIRTSNWDAISLSKKQIDYAALDAWVALEIYNKVNGLPKSIRIINADPGDSVAIFPSSVCSGAPCAYGIIVDQNQHDSFFLDNHKCITHANSTVISRRRCVVVLVTSVVRGNMLCQNNNK
ncbi:hypothetical protein BDB01DRAFT_835291 [Pilobolus umbonatus]|nr:hypothetical protein BDB01DRAFT_835291 [Pilobolus umbonatus]